MNYGNPKSRTLKVLRPFVAAASVAVLAACGSSPSAGTSGAGPSTPTAGDTPASASALTFSACMRSNGVSRFPDPDASGQLTIDAVANGSSIDTNSAAFIHALAACKSLEPSGFTGTQRNAQQTEIALQFAQCMRDNGVKDFPDPTPDGPLIDTTRIPSLAGKDPRTALAAPLRACSSYSRQLGITGS